ncbi:hypothetical protein MACK_002019 [Theileria orientalis]|uniref:Sfi1 spindle body domain-containing protein n=1 Tax=Theileria orientalis TaxID=68886 RepID=A0A976MB01_THEOR|nr:hypothetical protein MACK_002019 [Theileria orientalis]
MGFLTYENYNDNTQPFYDNFLNNGDSTLDVAGYGPEHQSGSLFNEIEPNTADLPFDYGNVENIHIRNVIHPLDRKLMNKAFRCLVIAYHDSVRNSVLDSLSDVYSRKHYCRLVLNSFLIPIRKKRYEELMEYAENYSMKKFIQRWRVQVLTLNEVKNNELSAKLYYESSLSSKCLKAFKALGKQSSLKNYKLLRLVSIIKSNLVCNIIMPWNELTKKYKRLDLCLTDLTNNHNKMLKNQAFNSIFNFYNKRVGVSMLDDFVRYYLKKRALYQIYAFYTHILQKQVCLDKKLKLVLAEKYFEHWRYMSLYKISSNIYKYNIKSKSFNKLKQYANYKMLLNKKEQIVSREMNRYLKDRVLTKMSEFHTSRKWIRTLIKNMISIVEMHQKRSSFKKLYEHYKIIEHELDNNLKAERFSKMVLFNRGVRSMYEYAVKRKGKKEKMLLAAMNYNRYLCSYVFDHMLKLYTEKENRNMKVLEQFNESRNVYLKRLYFSSFRRAILKTMRLDKQYELISNNYDAYLASTVFKSIHDVIRTNHSRKLSLIASILSANEEREEGYNEETTDEVNTKVLSSSRVSVKMLLASTKPLKSECLSFLLYLLAFKSKFNEVYHSYFSKNEDELVNKLMDKLTSEQLGSIKSKYALLLHETRLLYLPQKSPYTSELQHYFEAIPTEIINLLQYLALDEIFKLNSVLKGNNTTYGSAYLEGQTLSGYTLLKLPLWRIINLKLLVSKKRKMLKTWRTMTEMKLKKKATDAEYYETFKDMSKMFTKITFFDEWVALTAKVIQTRTEMKLQKYNRFTEHIDALVLNRKGLGYLLIYLTYMSSRYSGVELNAKLRVWFIRFLKNNQNFQHASLVAVYLSNQRIFTSWKNFSLWYSKIKRDALEFNRINVLMKSFKLWFTSTAYLNNKREELCQTISGTSDSILKYATLNAWHKLSRLHKVIDSEKRNRNLMMKSMKIWKEHTDTVLLRRHKYETIQKSCDDTVLNVYFNKWYEHYRVTVRNREMDLIANSHYYTTTASKYLLSWMELTRKMIRLGDAREQIEEDQKYTIKYRHFNAMYKYWRLSEYQRRSITMRTFVILRLLAFTYKLTRLIEKRQTERTKESIREFYNLIKSNRKYHLECENIIMNHKKLYSILYRLSDINKDRIVQGLRVMNANAYYRTRFNLVRKRVNSRLLDEYYRRWVEVSSYNRAWIKKIEGVYTYLSYIKSPNDAKNSNISRKDLVITDKSYQLKALKAKYLRNLYVNALAHWKRSHCVLDTSYEVLECIYSFAHTSRLIQALRVLQENFMDRRWNEVCAYRVVNFESSMNFKTKSRVFNHLKCLVKPNMDSLLSVYDPEYLDPTARSSESTLNLALPTHANDHTAVVLTMTGSSINNITNNSPGLSPSERNSRQFTTVPSLQQSPMKGAVPLELMDITKVARLLNGPSESEGPVDQDALGQSVSDMV